MIRICHEEIRNSEDLISQDFFSRFLTLTINYVNTNADNCVPNRTWGWTTM